VKIESDGQFVVIDLLGNPIGAVAHVPEIVAGTRMPHVAVTRSP
jgi:hypothetical protein